MITTITDIHAAGDLRLLDQVAFVRGTDDDEPIEGGLVVGLKLAGWADARYVDVTYEDGSHEVLPSYRSLLVTRKA